MLTRRSFVSLSAMAGAAALVGGPRLGFAAAADAYTGATSVDMLCNSPDITDDNVAHLVAAGLTAIVFDIPVYPRDYDGAVKEMARWNSFFVETKLPVLRVEKSADLATAKRDKKLGVILACQDASIVGIGSGDYTGNLEMFHRLGLRVLQLTHNQRTSFADSFMEKRDAGLSRAGEDLVKNMNELGVLIDLSHCSPQTLFDTMALSSKPCVVTHAGCKALAATARNKSDAEIKALGAKGGVFGVYDMTLWLTDKPTADVDTVVDHIDHVAQLIGADHVGFGSDGAVEQLDADAEAKRMAGVQQRWAGGPSFEWPVRHVRVPELNGPGRLRALADALGRRGYKDADIAGIVGGNFARVFQQVCG